MADIVLGLGTSHSPMLNSPAEDYPKHAEIDAKGRRLLDKFGCPTSYYDCVTTGTETHHVRKIPTKSAIAPPLENSGIADFQQLVTQSYYGDLLANAHPSIKDQLRLEVMQERVEKCTASIEKIAQELAAAKLDALVVIGDDQNEQYADDNMPAILIYTGETIANNPLHMDEDAPEFWRRARSQYHEEKGAREYPVAAGLALHIVDHLMDQGFDISHSKRLGKDIGEGHAFGFVHKRIMKDSVIPIVPVAINTYSAPNQPRPRRCYQLGREIRNAVRSATGYQRVGILGSGGLSHFYLDEELDHRVLDACRNKDGESLSTIPPAQLNSGSSEIRNWITAASASEHLDTKWQEYYPCYRSPAGTGYGAGFAVWR